jgi:general secretion pathway protein I
MRPKAAGFTLLEAIVALAILAAGTMALFAALNGALRSIERAEAAVRLDSATESAVALLESINPTARPEGEAPLGAYRLRWRATLVAGPSEALTGYFQPGFHEVALYDVDVELHRGATLERRFVLRRAGWRQVRQPEVL